MTRHRLSYGKKFHGRCPPPPINSMSHEGGLRQYFNQEAVKTRKCEYCGDDAECHLASNVWTCDYCAEVD